MPKYSSKEQLDLIRKISPQMAKEIEEKQKPTAFCQRCGKGWVCRIIRDFATCTNCRTTVDLRLFMLPKVRERLLREAKSPREKVGGL